VSAYFHDHSVSQVFLGWLQYHNRDRFEVYAYHVGRATDAITDDVRRCSMRFRHLPDAFEETARAIRSDNLHILVFLDIGMAPITTLLAALRLAPIQAATWGHMTTSGLSTVDYFLSGELMEPPNGQSHYSEQLIRLPGVGICHRKPVIPKALLHHSRRDYGLREDAIIYLSSQSVFKYLPQHDDVYPAIANRLPASQFVFFAWKNDSVLADFQTRLERAFQAAGLRAADHCVYLRRQDIFGYWNVNLLADVYLDTLEWAGFNTTLQAMACGLPIVTLPGQSIRGRGSYALLTVLGATETVARDKAQYVDIAVRLGQNRPWRQRVVDRVKAGCGRFYSDTTSVAALEDFYSRIVEENRSGKNGSRAPKRMVASQLLRKSITQA
jgi:predicted O-linked N-acetylglucosamine transferase (SPINDLY family)